MSNEEKKDEKPVIPTYAPTPEEIAQTETGTPVIPEEYPLFKKLDALIEGQKRVAIALETIASNIPALIGATKKTVPAESKTTTKPAESTAPAPVAQPVQEQKPSKLEEVKMSFPEDLETLLYFEEKGGYVILKPRQFLGSENFAKIASVVRGLGGEYISAGKDSHFRVKA